MSQQEKRYPHSVTGLFERMKDKNVTAESYKTVEPRQGQYVYRSDVILPPDSDVVGFSKGMDDLAQIILNNKKEVKFERNLVTEEGAKYWIARKNATIKGNKKWNYAVQDINGDGVPEVVIRDGNGQIRYINGFGIGKGKHKFNYAYQTYIDKLGNPQERMIRKATHQIQKGQTSKKNFLYDHLRQDEENPDGALIPIGYLKDVGYKTRAPSACNLFMSYVMKNIYDNAIEHNAYDDATENAMRKVFGLIQANAYYYAKYVTEPVLKQLAADGISQKEAKKKREGRPTEFSERSLKKVKEIFDSLELQKQILRDLMTQMEQVKKDHLSTIYEIKEHEPYNPRYYAETGPDIEKYIRRYEVKGTKQMAPREERNYYKQINLNLDERPAQLNRDYDNPNMKDNK